MIRTLVTIAGALCLAGCAASRPALSDASGAAFRLTLDKNLVGAPELPSNGSAADDNSQTCRRVEVAWSRIRRKVCEDELNREHLRNAAQAGLRALRRSESGSMGPMAE